MQVHRRRAWLLAGSLLVAACGGGGNDDGDAAPSTSDASRRATTSTSPSTSSTTSSAPPTTTSDPAVDPSVIPEDPAAIDGAYVEAVANELYRVLGEANAIQVEGADLQGLVDRFNAVYATQTVDLLLNDALARTDSDLAKFKRPTGAQRIAITTVMEATEKCVVAEALRDSSDVLIEPPPPLQGFIVLTARDQVEAGGLNSTAWMIAAFSPLAEGEVSCGIE